MSLSHLAPTDTMIEDDDSPKASPPIPLWKKVVPIVVGVTMVAGTIYWVGFASLLKSLEEANPTSLSLGVLALALSAIGAGVRWHLGIRYLFGLSVRLTKAVQLYLESQIITSLVPGAQATGDIWRTLGLYRTVAKSGGHWLECLYSTVWDRVLGLWSVFFISLIASLFAPIPTDGSAGLQRLMSAIVWVEAIVVVGFPLFIVLLPLLPTALKNLRPLRAWVVLSLRIRTHKLATLSIVMISLLVLIASALGWAMALHAVAPHLSLSVGLATAATIFVAASMPVGMGGWGTREVAAVQVMSAYGLGAADALGASVLLGLMSTVLAVLLSPTFLWSVKTK